MNNYQKTIGIEVHCELKTKTKMFSDTLNSYEGSENSHINGIDLAYPGSLPLVNLGAVKLACKAALLLHCTINKTMSFDRKNYFILIYLKVIKLLKPVHQLVSMDM